MFCTWHVEKYGHMVEPSPLTQIITCSNWEETDRDKKQKEASGMVVDWIKVLAAKPTCLILELTWEKERPTTTTCLLTSAHTPWHPPPSK